jgi:hypothetical protein
VRRRRNTSCECGDQLTSRNESGALRSRVDLEPGGAVGPKQRDRDGHVDGLVRSVVVVSRDPAVDGVLGGGDGLKRGDVIKELGAQGLVEALDLPGRGG